MVIPTRSGPKLLGVILKLVPAGGRVVSVEVVGGVVPGTGDVFVPDGGVAAGDRVESATDGAPTAFVVSSDEVSPEVSVFVVQATTENVSAAAQKNLVTLFSHLSVCFSIPEIRILEHHTSLIDLEIAPEFSAAALVPIDILGGAGVSLLQHFQRYLRVSQPRRANLGSVTNPERETTDRQQISRRTEAQIDILASRELRLLDAVQRPLIPLVADVVRNPCRSHVAADPAVQSPPIGITFDGVLRTAGNVAKREIRDAGEPRAALCSREGAELVTWLVKPAPEDGNVSHRALAAASLVPPL
jgi:hypothetical protein